MLQTPLLLVLLENKNDLYYKGAIKFEKSYSEQIIRKFSQEQLHI